MLLMMMAMMMCTEGLLKLIQLCGLPTLNGAVGPLTCLRVRVFVLVCVTVCLCVCLCVCERACDWQPPTTPTVVDSVAVLNGWKTRRQPHEPRREIELTIRCRFCLCVHTAGNFVFICNVHSKRELMLWLFRVTELGFLPSTNVTHY